MNPSDSDTLGKLLRKNKRLTRDLTRIETIFNAIRSAIVVFESEGEIKFANNYAREVLAIGDKAVSIFKLLSGIEDAVAEVCQHDSVVLREFEITYPEPRVFSSQIIPFDFGGGVDTFALILNDVTNDRRSAEERIENEKIASVLNLASGVAHELGNPLNSINIHLQLIRRRLGKIADETNKQLLSSIKESVDICSSEVSRLDSIIENFLKALRPMRPNLVVCDAVKPLAETLKVLHEELLNLRITVDVDIKSQLPTTLADENLLKQLYFNILKNAMESMSQGGRISIKAVSDDRFVNLSFSDSGCGMSEEELSRMFEPYFTTKPDGHGLGMMIINAIIKAHDGRINIKSKQGEGTVISISIPRSDPLVKMLSQAEHK